VSRVVAGVTVTDDALTQLVTVAAEQVDGVRVRRRGVALEEERVELSLAARHGVVLPEAAREVQERVADAFSTMCGVTIAVDVSVDEIE
jgi:uncharacterized alkaline shock family protein YloU